MTTTFTKLCPVCREVKSGDDFAYDARARDGHQSRCRACDNRLHLERRQSDPEHHRKIVRRSNFKQRHKITGLDGWVDAQYEKQGGVCAMVDCNKRLSDGGHALCVDHDHETNKLRGLLCRECNLALDWYEKNKHRHVAFDAYLAGGDDH
jgi:hypothetical protein